MKQLSLLALPLLLILGLSLSPAQAQQVFAYPKAGQTPEQQAQDQAACHQWAVGQARFDPYAAQQPAPSAGYSSTPPPRQRRTGILGLGSGGLFQGGGLLGDSATGAALGAAGGAIAGDAGKGAAWGALGGALIGGIKRRNQEQERADWERQRQQQLAYQQQQQQQVRAQGMQNYSRAYSACMTSRNYQVQ